ncbi:hypothetical protein MED222_05615 [Vibrio sp. MED222]|nr:hypothetical protein MED222_05615 [Vibrio sp. MED222]
MPIRSGYVQVPKLRRALDCEG